MEIIKFAFICETQFHIFNAINFTANNIEDSKGNSDIYIYNKFASAKNITERLKNTKLFKNVYFINTYNEDVDVFTKFRNLFRMFFPKKTILIHIDKPKEFKNKNYKYLCMYSYTMRNRNFIRAFNNADVIMIEDGIGAYIGNLMKDHVNGLYKLMDKYVFWGKYECNPIKAYVYCPEICGHDVTSNIYPLPKMNNNNPSFDIINTVFQYRENDLYKNKRFLYFTQPLELLPGGYMPDSEDKIFDVINSQNMTKDLVYRVHPRQKNFNTNNCDTDTMGNFWEIESPVSVNENHIFISACSTAAFTPKYISDLEPYLIFYYKLCFKETDSEYWRKMDEFIKRFGSLYNDKSKVFVPESYDELKEILIKLGKNK